MREVGKHVEAARARGVDVAADLYLYTAGGTGLDSVIPSWAHEGGHKALLERLQSPQTRARLKQEIKTGSPGWWNIIEAAGRMPGRRDSRQRAESGKRALYPARALQ